MIKPPDNGNGNDTAGIMPDPPELFTMADVQTWADLHWSMIVEESNAQMAENADGQLMASVMGMEFCRQQYAAGFWLGFRLREMGVDSDQIKAACFAVGQFSMIEKPYAAAAKVANQFKVHGQLRDQPGPELAERIHQRWLEILRKAANGWVD